MRLLVIRHGESEADLLDVHEGRADFSLTERGRQQAEALAQYIARAYRDLSRIYCSTLTRARQTAQYVSDQISIPVEVDDMLMEFNNGLIAGLKRDVAAEKYPLIADLPVHASVYEQESKLAFRYRADVVLSKVMSENDADAVIALITHGGMINQLYHSFLRLPVDSDIIFRTGDTGIHEWHIDQHARRTVVKANETAHTIR